MSESALWDKLFQTAWDGAKWAFGGAAKYQQSKRAAQEYRDYILREYGTTRILGKPDPVPLENIYTDVLIWDKPHYVRHITPEALQKALQQGNLHRDLKRVDGLAVFELFPRLFVLGKPGAGKTTFLKSVALLEADGYWNRSTIPIFVSLKEMADAGRTIWEQIVHSFNTCKFPDNDPDPFVKALLGSANALILLDGLDEVQAESGMQDRVIDDIRDFVRNYGKNRFILTCRVAAVSYAFENFKYVEMADFTDDQIKTYISRYFINNPETAEACWIELNKPDHKGLHEISGSPLLLSLLCLNYEEGGIFPARRVDLYEDALKALLTKWDGSRRIRRDEPYKQLPIGRKPQLYAQIAYDNIVQGKYFITTRELAQQVETYLQTVPGIEEADGEIVLKSMEAQHGIIAERARQVHGFAHLTFQEYYTAKYIVDNVGKGTLFELMKHVSDSEWSEVFLLTASLLPDASTFFDLFLQAVNSLIVKDKPICDWITLSPSREIYYPTWNSLKARWWILYLDLAHAFDRVFDQGEGLTFEVARVFERSLVLTLNLAINLAFTLNLVYDDTLVRALSLKRARAFDVDLASLDHVSRIDFSLWLLGRLVWLSGSVPPLIENSLIDAKAITDIALAEALAKISLPQTDEPIEGSKEWSQFRQAILMITETHRGLRWNWQFTKEQINQIGNFFQATTLLVECLNLAVVSDREEIKARLLMPPPAAED